MKSNITIINAASGGAIDIPAGEAEVDVKVVDSHMSYYVHFINYEIL